MNICDDFGTEFKGEAAGKDGRHSVFVSSAEFGPASEMTVALTIILWQLRRD